MSEKIVFCKKCLYSNLHPLGIIIHEDGICSGCKVHKEKDILDWDERFKKLKKITQYYKKRSNNNYDCIVPISGANDSYYIIYIVKEKLGLNPLLVCYNKHFNTSIGIKNLANLRIIFDCDILYQNININSIKKITKSSLERFGNIYWPIIAGYTNFPVHVSIRYKIPLIIWGAHQGLEQVGMFSHLNEIEMTRVYRKQHDLLGMEANDLVTPFDNLNNNDLNGFKYPTHKEIYDNKTRGIYLGNYIRWDPKKQHELMIKKYGYITNNFIRTFDKYDHVDCFNYMNLHDILKLYKHGYSKVTDHATREIRHGRINRDQGLSLVKKYELKKINYKEQFCNWLNISQKSLDFVLNENRNINFWKKIDYNVWKFKGYSTKQTINNKVSTIKFENSFINNSGKKHKFGKNYITIGKGYNSDI